MSKARIVTVHLVIAEQNENESEVRYDDAANIADGVSALLQEAQTNGFLLDWGYAANATPQQAKVIDDYDYEEGDFYELADLPYSGMTIGA